MPSGLWGGGTARPPWFWGSCQQNLLAEGETGRWAAGLDGQPPSGTLSGVFREGSCQVWELPVGHEGFLLI